MSNTLKKSKTDLLLETIQPKEFMNFERYLVSRLGKSHNLDYYGYWSWKKDCIIKTHHGNSGEIKPYRHSLSRKFLSDFNKLIEGYFIGVSVERDAQLKNILLLNEMHDRKVDKLFVDYLKKGKELDDNHLLIGLINNITSMRYQFEEYMMLNAMLDESGMVKIAGEICKTSEYVYFQNEMFNYINNKIYSGKAFEPALNFKIVLKKIEEDKEYFRKHYANIYILYMIVKLIDDYKSVDDVVSVIMQINKYENKFTDKFIKFIYESLFSAALVKIRIDNDKDIKLTYKLIKEIESQGILDRIPHLQPIVFFSLVSLSLMSEDIDLAEKIISRYSIKLFCVPHDDVIAICRAMVDFEVGKLNSAKTLLMNLNIRNSTLYIYAKVTYLKVLYEKNELRGIMSYSDTIKHFLHRKEKINEAFKGSVCKFLSYTTNLALAKRKNGRGLIQLREKYDLESTFFQKRWVLRKLTELEKIYLL